MKSDSPTTSHYKQDLITPSLSIPIRGNFKRVLSAERPELQTTVASLDAPKTLPDQSLDEPFLFPREWQEEKEGQGEERFSVRFRKVEMSPSAMMEKQLFIGKGNNEDSTEIMLPCVVVFNGKTASLNFRIHGGQLQFSNGCAIRLSRVSKAKVCYEDYQKCLWLTYDQGQSQGRSQQAKLRLHLPHDVRDDLYLLFARIILQKLALMAVIPSLPSPEEGASQDRFRMEGMLLKRSQFLGKWAQRRVVVTDCVQSFRGGRCTFAMRNLKELWTRFDRHEDCLIVKVRHGSEKTELGLPVVHFPERFCRRNWLYRLYRLLSAPLV